MIASCLKPSHGTAHSSSPAEEDGPISAACTRKAAAAGLSAAATQARMQAEEEEVEIQKLLRDAVAAQQELLENRLKLFPEMLQAMQEEHNTLQVLTEPTMLTKFPCYYRLCDCTVRRLKSA